MQFIIYDAGIEATHRPALENRLRLRLLAERRASAVFTVKLTGTVLARSCERVSSTV